MNQYAGWEQNLTITPGEYQGDMHTDLFLYDRQNARGWFYIIDGEGAVSRNHPQPRQVPVGMWFSQATLTSHQDRSFLFMTGAMTW